MLIIFCVVLAVIVLLNVLSANKSNKKTEQTIRTALEAKGQMLAKNNSIALSGMAADNAFGSIHDLVISTVEDDADLSYGIYMDNSQLPFVNYTKGGSKEIQTPQPLTDSVTMWASALAKPGMKTYWRGKKDEVIEFAAPVKSGGETLGFIRYGLSTRNMNQQINAAKIAGLISLVVTLTILLALFAVSLVLAFKLLKDIAVKITKPIDSLVKSTKTIAEGNYNVEIHPESDDEIGALSEDFENMRQTVKKFTDHLQDLVDEKMQQVNDILNNIDQGLFTINLDGTINREYSSRANDILKVADVSSCSITELFRLDIKQEDAFKQWLDLVTDRHEKQRWNKLVRLSPVLQLELGANDKVQTEAEEMMDYVAISYQKIFDKQGNLCKIMVLALDETEKRLKDLQMKQERERHENEVKAILGVANTPQEEITEFVEDTETRVVRLREKITEHKEKVAAQRRDFPDGPVYEVKASNIDEIYRDIHTIKGNGGSYGFELLSAFAHKAEDYLEELKSPVKSRREDIFSKMLENVEQIALQLEDVREKMKLIYGSEEDLSIKVPEARISKITSLCNEALQTSGISKIVKDLVEECTMLSWKPLKTLARKYQKTAQKAARRLNKDIDFEVIDELKMHPSNALSVIDDALIHLVRNSADHGIESDEVRAEVG